MLSIGVNILTEATKTALFSAVSTKIVDKLVTSRLNKNSDHKKWLRETKLQLFTQISKEILSFEIQKATTEDEKRLKEVCSKTLMVLEDKRLIYEIEKFLKVLSSTQRALTFENNNIEEIKRYNQASMDLVISLNKNLKRV